MKAAVIIPVIQALIAVGIWLSATSILNGFSAEKPTKCTVAFTKIIRGCINDSLYDDYDPSTGYVQYGSDDASCDEDSEYIITIEGQRVVDCDSLNISHSMEQIEDSCSSQNCSKFKDSKNASFDDWTRSENNNYDNQSTIENNTNNPILLSIQKENIQNLFTNTAIFTRENSTSNNTINNNSNRGTPKMVKYGVAFTQEDLDDIIEKFKSLLSVLFCFVNMAFVGKLVARFIKQYKEFQSKKRRIAKLRCAICTKHKSQQQKRPLN